MRGDEGAIRNDAALMLEKCGETMRAYLPGLLPHVDHETTLYKVKIMDTTVPVQLSLVVESMVRWSAGQKRHAKRSEPKDKVCLRRNRYTGIYYRLLSEP